MEIKARMLFEEMAECQMVELVFRSSLRLWMLFPCLWKSFLPAFPVQGLLETLKPMDTQLWAASCLEVRIWIWIFWDSVESLKGDWDCHCFSFGCYWKFTVNALNSDTESTFESCIRVLPVPRTLAENLWYKLHVFVKATAHIQRVKAENNLSL